MAGSAQGSGFRWARELALTLLTAGVSLVTAVWSLGIPLRGLSGLWSTAVGSKWSNSDLVLGYAMSKVIDEQGWLTTNPFLGAPSVQDFSHFPYTGLLNLLEIKILLTLGLDPIAATNAVFLLSFPIIGALTYLAFRFLRIHPAVAVLLAIGFALIPWHYYRLSHLFLANYWVLPIILVWLALLLQLVPPWRFLTNGRALAMGVVAAVVIGWHDPHYAVFAMVLGGVGLLLRARSGNLLGLWSRIAIWAVVPVSLAVAAVVVRMGRVVPAIEPAAVREVRHQYSYSGHLLSLFTAEQESWSGGIFPMDRLGEALANPYPTGLGEGQARFSLLVALSVLAAVVWALAALMGTVPPGRRTAPAAWRQATPWSSVLVLALLLFVTTGIGLAIGALVSPQIRAWGRLSIVIALLGLTVLGLLVTGLAQRARKTGVRWPFWTALGAVSLLLVEALSFRGAIAADSTTGRALTEFAADARAVLGPDCPVLSLPFIPFPEAESETGTSTYDQLLPYLYSSGRPYSAGGFRGQLGANWGAGIDLTSPDLAARAKASGFCGLLLDAAAVPDPGASIQALSASAGPPRAVALDRWYLFPLEYVRVPEGTRPLTSELDVREISGFYAEESIAGGPPIRYLASSEGVWALGNPTTAPMPVRVSGVIGLPNCAESADFEIVLDGRSTGTIEVSTQGQSEFTYSSDVTLAPGQVAELKVLQSGPLCPDRDRPRDIGVSSRWTFEEVPVAP